MLRANVLRLFTFAASLFMSSANAAGVVTPFSSSAYAENANTKGVILVSANWARKWGCGRFENAQLKSLSFDRAGALKTGNDAKADFVLEDTSIFPAASRFVNYAYIAEPGEYLLSGFLVKRVLLASDISYAHAGRTTLIQDGRSKAGSFTVSAGEIVYIGHFFLDCYQEPIPWRYYTRDKASFSEFLSDIKGEFGALDVTKAKFRLFDTEILGKAFVLQ